MQEGIEKRNFLLTAILILCNWQWIMELGLLHFLLYQREYIVSRLSVELAAKIAIHTVNRFLQDNPDCFDLVEWVLFDTHTESVYEAEADKLYDK